MPFIQKDNVYINLTTTNVVDVEVSGLTRCRVFLNQPNRWGEKSFHFDFPADLMTEFISGVRTRSSLEIETTARIAEWKRKQTPQDAPVYVPAGIQDAR